MKGFAANIVAHGSRARTFLLSLTVASLACTPAPAPVQAPMREPTSASATITTPPSPAPPKAVADLSLEELIARASDAAPPQRDEILESITARFGAHGLVAALEAEPVLPKRKPQRRQLLDAIRDLADPRGGDDLARYLDSHPPPHERTEAALRLAEIGDLRAVSHLAWRLRQDPLKLYDPENDPELRSDDHERVACARGLADLATLYPDRRADLLHEAEDAALDWATGKPQPHANALRFLAIAGSQKALPKLRAWANPPDPLPSTGEASFSPAWATAQSALRYVGRMRDEKSFGVLANQLARRPAGVDVTMDSLMQGGIAALGMTVRSLGVGAAQGFAEWGDPRAAPLLVRAIDDAKGNEQSRLEACKALAWVADDREMLRVALRVTQTTKAGPREAFVRGCYLETLSTRAAPDATAALLPLLAPAVDPTVRAQAAQAIGLSGMSVATMGKVADEMATPGVAVDAALALLLGGTPDAAAKAVSRLPDAPSQESLKMAYLQALGSFTDRALEGGHLTRFVKNARACAPPWPRQLLGRALQAVEYDAGPHSLTGVVLRMRLFADAKGSDEARRNDALAMLEWMHARGALMALGRAP